MKFNLLLLRLVASFAALVLPLAPAVAQTTLTTPTARVIVKYNADSPLLRRETLASGSQRVTAREALGQRIGLALRAGADLGERGAFYGSALRWRNAASQTERRIAALCQRRVLPLSLAAQAQASRFGDAQPRASQTRGREAQSRRPC